MVSQGFNSCLNTKFADDVLGQEQEAQARPVRELLDEAKRDLAFKRWATAADKFGEVLEQL